MLKLLRFIRQWLLNTEEDPRSVKMAKVISNQLNNVLSTRAPPHVQRTFFWAAQTTVFVGYSFLDCCLSQTADAKETSAV